MKKEWKPSDSLKQGSESWHKRLFRLKTGTKIASDSCMCAMKLTRGGWWLLQLTDLRFTSFFFSLAGSSSVTQSIKEDIIYIVCSEKEYLIERDKLLIQVCLESSFAVIYVKDCRVKPLTEKSFKTNKEVNKIYMFIECLLVIFFLLLFSWLSDLSQHISF